MTTLTYVNNGNAKRAPIGGELDKRHGSKLLELQRRRCLTWPVSKQAAECLTLRQARVSQLLWQLSALEEEGTYWRRIILLAC